MSKDTGAIVKKGAVKSEPKTQEDLDGFKPGDTLVIPKHGQWTVMSIGSDRVFCCTPEGPFHCKPFDLEDALVGVETGAWGVVKGEWRDAVVKDLDKMTNDERHVYQRNCVAITLFDAEYGPDYLGFEGNQRKPIYKTLEKRLGLDRKTFQRLFERYLRSGCSRASLQKRPYPHRQSDGGMYVRHWTVKPGPKGGGVNLSDPGVDHYARMEKGIRRMGRRKLSKRAAWRVMVAKEYREEFLSSGEDYHATGLWPSYRQFCAYFDRSRSAMARLAAGKDPRKVRNDHRLTMGSPSAKLTHPMQRCEVDQWEADVILVSRWDPTQVMGKPTVGLLIDELTGTVVAYYVGYERDTAIGSLNLILSLLDDKEQMLKDAGREVPEGFFWPHHVLPDEIRTDHGSDYTSDAYCECCLELGIHLAHVPPAMGSMKGAIESAFKQVLAHAFPSLAGAGATSKEEPSDKAAKEACLTLQEFDCQFLLPFLVRYNMRRLERYAFTPEMEAAGVEHTPQGRWEWFEGLYRGVRHVQDETFVLKAALSRAVGAKIDRSCVHFKGLRYSFEGDAELMDRALMAGRKKEDFEALYDPRDDSYLYFERDGKLVWLPLQDHPGNIERQGQDFSEIALEDEIGAWHRADDAAYNEHLWIAQALDGEEVVAKAKKRAKAAGRKKKGGIEDARRAEKEALRREQSVAVRAGIEPTYEVPEDGQGGAPEAAPASGAPAMTDTATDIDGGSMWAHMGRSAYDGEDY